MTREEIGKIWEDVKENHRKLDCCPGPHDFQATERTRTGLVRSWTCKTCKGQIGSVEKVWYERGLKHGWDHPQTRVEVVKP